MLSQRNFGGKQQIGSLEETDPELTEVKRKLLVTKKINKNNVFNTMVPIILFLF